MADKIPLKPIAQAVVITPEGIRDFAREMQYWDDWMLKKIGRKVFCFMDCFSKGSIVIYDFLTNEFLGNAKPVVRLKGRMFKHSQKLFVYMTGVGNG